MLTGFLVIFIHKDCGIVGDDSSHVSASPLLLQLIINDTNDRLNTYVYNNKMTAKSRATISYESYETANAKGRAPFSE